MSRETANYTTFLLSAIWHGFYPAYYIAFTFISILSISEKIVYKNKEKLKFFPTIYFRIAFELATILFFNVIITELLTVIKYYWPFYLSILIVFLLLKIYTKPTPKHHPKQQ